jgi:hypothetical protein
MISNNIDKGSQHIKAYLIWILYAKSIIWDQYISDRWPKPTSDLDAKVLDMLILGHIYFLCDTFRIHVVDRVLVISTT